MSLFDKNTSLAQNPVVLKDKSIFNRDYTHTTTFSAGRLVPIYFDEVYPGDVFDVSTNYVLRGATPINPVLDNAVLEIFYFFVPTRLVWDNWQKFNGENDDPWTTNQQELTVPQVVGGTKLPESYTPDETTKLSRMSYAHDSLAAYLGIPSYVNVCNNTTGFSALPFRAYCKIWNDWFRDQNYQQTIPFKTNDDDVYLSLRKDVDVTTQSWLTNCPLGVECAPVSRKPDYFSTALPSPQKSIEPVGIPFSFSGSAPVTGTSITSQFTGQPTTIPFGRHNLQTTGTFKSSNGTFPNTLITYAAVNNRNVGGQGLISPITGAATVVPQLANNQPISLNDSITYNNHDAYIGVNIQDKTFTPTGSITNTISNPGSIDFSSSDISVMATINDLRNAIALQQIFELDARGGSRYTELLFNHFGVISPDARLQRSEYLGKSRDFINMQQVIQNSQSTNVSPLGQTGAYSLTTGGHNGFMKAFTEHGYVFGLATVRVMHTYAQGLPKEFSRLRRFDYYLPKLANLGEQPIYKKELYFEGYDAQTIESSKPSHSEIWGYNEAFADLRFKPNRVSGRFAPQDPLSLRAWTYVDKYTAPPTLTSAWMVESPENIAQTMAVQTEPQYWGQFYFRNQISRVMPTHSIPGLAKV